MNPYTVILLYPDYMTDNYGQETYLAHVEAPDTATAVAKARKAAMKANPGSIDTPTDLFVTACFAGHHADLCPGGW